MASWMCNGASNGRRSREKTYTGSHFTETVKDTVEDNEKREDLLNRVQRSTDDEAKNSPEILVSTNRGRGNLFGG